MNHWWRSFAVTFSQMVGGESAHSSLASSKTLTGVPMDLAYPPEFGKLIIPNVSYFPAVKPDICLPYFLSGFWYRLRFLEEDGFTLKKKSCGCRYRPLPTAVAKFQTTCPGPFKYFNTIHLMPLDYSHFGWIKGCLLFAAFGFSVVISNSRSFTFPPLFQTNAKVKTPKLPRLIKVKLFLIVTNCGRFFLWLQRFFLAVL